MFHNSMFHNTKLHNTHYDGTPVMSCWRNNIHIHTTSQHSTFHNTHLQSYT